MESRNIETLSSARELADTLTREACPGPMRGAEDGFIASLLAEHSDDRFALHERHLNRQWVKVLRTIGFDRRYVSGRGAYLYDDRGERYLDLLSGWGTFAIGRNHPTVKAALAEVLAGDLPNLVQMDVSVLSGLLAEALIETAPGMGLERVVFANSGAEAVEGAIKLARHATGRRRIICCGHAFHGLTYGALSLTDGATFREGFGPLLPDCASVPFDDLAALEAALSAGDVAAFVVEPVQGHGVNIPGEAYLPEAARLCREHGTVFVADEVQCGLGRTGRMWAVEHWGAEPDILLTSKALSGGFVPVSAILCRSAIFDKVFDRMDRAAVHGSTFSKNDMAMAAGLATLKIIREERLVERAATMGARLLSDLAPLVERFEFVHDVRGKGLMIAIEFGRPDSLKLKAAWSLLSAANESLFSQMILIPLFKDHHVLAQVAGHGIHVIKLLPPFVISDDDRAWTASALESVIAEAHKVPGSIWSLGRSLLSHAVKANAND